MKIRTTLDTYLRNIFYFLWCCLIVWFLILKKLMVNSYGISNVHETNRKTYQAPTTSIGDNQEFNIQNLILIEEEIVRK